MHERPLALAAMGLLLGILACTTQAVLLWIPVLWIGSLLILQVKRDKWKAVAAFRLFLFVICLVLGWYRCRQEEVFRAAYESKLTDGAKIIVQGTLDEKEFKNEKYLYYLKNCYLVLSEKTIPCNQIIAEAKQDLAAIGEVLIVEGVINAFSQARNEGNFDELSFYQSQKIDLRIKEINILGRHGEVNQFREGLFLLRQKLCDVYELCMTADTSGVLARMVLGEKSLLDSEIKDLYQKVGISHILAISGLHISVIGMTLYKTMRRFGCSYWFAGSLSGFFMVAYGMMTGFRPSSSRAICMFLMILLAAVVGRTYDSLSALSLSAFLLLYENPFLLTYAGFLFSFAAVIGVVLVANAMIKTLEEKYDEDSIRKKIWKTFYTSFSIQLMTLPLTAYFYYEIPVYGILINLLILPLVGVLLSMGIVGGVLGLTSLGLAKWMLLPCQLILVFYQHLSALIQKFPYAALITGQPELERLTIYYLILFGLVFVITKLRKQKFFGLMGTLLLIYVLTIPSEGLKLSILDVGQGDGIHIKTDADCHLFIDGGSSDVYQVGTYRILPYLKANGVRKIDYWFVSHADADHISGLVELLETGYEIDHLVFSEAIVSDEAYKNLLELAAINETKVVWMGHMDRLHLGDAVFTCVFPDEGFKTEDKNSASLVLLYEEGAFAGLFTGDIGADEERFIAKTLTDLQIGELDFYKVAHHGSKYSNSELFLDVLRPEMAVVSCGINNRYGHPHADTLERLAATGCEVWNTAECGQVTIEMDKNATSTTLELTPFHMIE